MTTTIYKFEQGRLLVHESRLVEANYRVSGVPVRIGQVREIEEVLSVDTDYSQYGLVTPLNEVKTSGHEIFVVMRRGDLGGLLSGAALSGYDGVGFMSGIGSGLPFLGEIRSGGVSGADLDWEISGKVTVTANVIGY